MIIFVLKILETLSLKPAAQISASCRFKLYCDLHVFNFSFQCKFVRVIQHQGKNQNKTIIYLVTENILSGLTDRNPTLLF